MYDGAIEVEADELVRVKVGYKQTNATESAAAPEVSEGLLASDVAADESCGRRSTQCGPSRYAPSQRACPALENGRACN